MYRNLKSFASFASTTFKKTSWRGYNSRYKQSIPIMTGLIALGGSASMVLMDGKSDSIDVLEEKVTKTNFPVTLQGYAHESSTHWLIGVSVRCMMGLCSVPYARAYSYGIYISQKGLERLKEEEDLGMKLNSDTIHKTLLPSEHIFPSTKPIESFIPSPEYQGKRTGYSYSKGTGYHLRSKEEAETIYKRADYDSCVLRLVMLRDVKCSHVARGFDTTFQRRLKGVHKEHKEACNMFLDVIKEDTNWTKGTILEFTRLNEGRLEVSINGESRLILESEAVSFALFDVYLGNKGHLYGKAKDNFISRCKESIFALS